MKLVLVLLFLLAAYIGVKLFLRKRRRDALLLKYGDIAVVNAIIAKNVWNGMTSEQLVDSWGPPLARDERRYKTKLNETFKYNRIGKRRYTHRVMLENGKVVGWETK